MDKTTNSALALAALFAATVATSCSSDRFSEGENSGNGEGKSVTLTAKVNESDATTRVGMNKETDDAVSFYWHSDDAILVQTVSGSTYSGAKFTTETETGKDLAEFTGTVESGSSLGTYAVYPYSDKHSFTLDEQSGTSKTVLTYNLPATYSYTTVESGIFSKTDGTSTTYRSTSTNMPMVGTITGNAIEFKHIGGLAVIRIDQMPAETGTLTVTANQQLCGDFTISDLSADDAAITTSTATTDNKTVTFSFSNANTGSVGVFYLPLATGSYTNVKIVLNSGAINQTVDYGNLTVSCASVTAIPVVANKVVNGHVFVDLGLSVLWAETNIGADNANDYGSYYSWGETSTKSSYSWNEYKYGTSYGNMTKYYSGDSKTALESNDDAATKIWGSSCRMATSSEISELKDNCTWTKTTVNSVIGYKVTSNKSGYTGNSIFLPLSGLYFNSNLPSQGTDGYYWSRSLNTDDNSTAYYLILHGDGRGSALLAVSRCYGCSVRAVAEKP